MLFTLTEATESDRTFLERMFFLTDVWGQEDQPTRKHFPQDLADYVGAWEPSQGGWIARDEYGVPGAALWLRIAQSEEEGACGFLSSDIPELVIAVEKRYQGSGLAKKLLTKALEETKKRGFRGLGLACDHGNDRAKQLYEKMGFFSLGPSPKGAWDLMVYYF